MSLRDLVLAALLALSVGIVGGGWYGHRQAVKACQADRWRAEAETLRITLAVRDAVALVDREIARGAAQASAETAAEYAKLRSDYATNKKTRLTQKTGLSGTSVSASVRLPDPTPAGTQGTRHYEKICPVADDLPVSDDLLGLYVSAFRPLLRTSP